MKWPGITMFLVVMMIIAAAPPVTGCPVVFTFDAGGSPATEVLIAGTFNGWADPPPSEWAMEDPDHDQIWELSTDLPIETYLYKLVVDGSWITDPENPEQDPDGMGGFNSVLDVTCGEPFFHVLSAEVDDSDGSFRATCLFASTDSPLDPSSVTVTMDHGAVPSGAVTLIDDQVMIHLQSIPDGIHDLRLEASEMDGDPAKMTLLKVYIGIGAEWADTCLYFVMTDRFRNGDPTNDDPFPGANAKTNYYGGDFQGITDSIQDGYFDDLGVSAIWISWPGDNPDHADWSTYIDSDECGLSSGGGHPTQDMQFSGFHGYWPTNTRQVEEHFGTMADLQQMVHAAHEHGIRILLDLTINHVHLD